MKRRTVLNSPRLKSLKKKKYEVLQRRIILFFIFLIVLLIGLSFLFKLEKININTISITGNKVIDTEALESIVSEEISGKYFWFFPKTNFLLYPKEIIYQRIETEFPRANTIDIKVTNLRNLVITISEHEASYLWCGDIKQPDNEECYFVNNKGYIFDKAPYFSGDIYLKFYGRTNDAEKSTSLYPISSYYLTTEKFNNLISLKKNVELFGINPTSFFLDEYGDIQMSLKNTSDESGPIVIFKADSLFLEVSSNLEAVLNTEPLKTDFREKYSSLEYIDLRFGNKVYFKSKTNE